MGPYDLGAPVPPADLAFTLTDSSGDPVQAASTLPVLTVTLPDQTTDTPAISWDSGSSTYRPSAPLVTTESGHHLWSWLCTDATYPGAYVDSFEVRLAPDPTIIALAEANEILHITAPTPASNSIVRGYSQAVTEWIEYECGPVVTRMFTENCRAQGRALVLSKAPVRTDLGTTIDTTYQRDGSTHNGIVSVTPLLSYGFMYDLDQLITDPVTGIVRHAAGFPFFYTADYLAQYKVTYWAGRKVIPWGIYEASKITLEHVYQIERGGVAAQDVTAGESTTFLPGFGFAVPNRAIQLLSPHTGSAIRAAFA